MEEGEGEYCLKSGQVLLEHVTCLGEENGYLGSLSQLQLGTAGTDHERWAGCPLAVLVQTWPRVWGPPGLA